MRKSLLQTESLTNPLLDATYKGYPRTQAARPRSQIGQAGWNVLAGDLPLPLAVLKREALEHNVAWMQARVRAWGVDFAPHGRPPCRRNCSAASSTPVRGASPSPR